MAGGLNALANLQGKVDANGALVVALDGSSPLSATVVTATTAFVLGAATTSGIRLDLETGVLAVREGDDSAYGPITASYGTLGNIVVGTSNDNLTMPGTGIIIFGGTRSRLSSPANGQINLTNQLATAGVGLDMATDATLKIRTTAQTGYATVDALAYQVSGVAGVSFSGAITNLTVVNGIVTAAS